jgi:hypothetical protein
LEQINKVWQLKDTINELTAAIEQQKEDKKNIELNETTWSTIVCKHVEKKFENVTGEMLVVQKSITETTQHMDEDKDKEKRRQNVIIYRAAESQATGPESCRKEDLDFCRTLVQMYSRLVAQMTKYRALNDLVREKRIVDALAC